MVVDENAGIDPDLVLRDKPARRENAFADDDHVAIHPSAVRKPCATHPAGALEGLGFDADAHRQAMGLEFVRNQAPGFGIHLHRQRVSRADQHGHRDPAPQQAVGSLEPHQPAAEHERPARLGQGRQHLAYMRLGAHEENVIEFESHRL